MSARDWLSAPRRSEERLITITHCNAHDGPTQNPCIAYRHFWYANARLCAYATSSASACHVAAAWLPVQVLQQHEPRIDLCAAEENGGSWI